MALQASIAAAWGGRGRGFSLDFNGLGVSALEMQKHDVALVFPQVLELLLGHGSFDFIFSSAISMLSLRPITCAFLWSEQGRLSESRLPGRHGARRVGTRARQ